MKITLVDIFAQYKDCKGEIDTAIKRVIQNSNFISGQEVEKFEKEFASYIGTKYAVGVNSGTSALFLALKVRGIGLDDEVIVPAFTFIATAEAVSMTGARPVFVDIEPQSYSINPEQVELVVTQKTRAIIPVHLYGQPADMKTILQTAKQKSLIVIEDAAQAHGAKYKNKMVGSLADEACFSFYPSKNLGAMGEAGAVTTNSKRVAQKIKMLRDHGQKQKNIHKILGYNMRMDGLQAAVLSVKLKYLNKWNKKRRQIAKTYTKLLKDIVQTPLEKDYAHHVYHLYAIRTSKRDQLQNYLERQGIQVGIYYPIPPHLQKAYQHLGHKQGDFPNAEKAAKEILSLPIYPHLKEKQVEFIAKTIRKFFGK